MTREEVAAVLGAELAVPLADAGMAATDTAGALKEPIDRALRGLGYAESALATAEPDDAPGFLALATYEALRAILKRMTSFTAMALPGGLSLHDEQSVKHVENLLKQAKEDVAAHFGVVPSGSTGGVVSIDLDFLAEPAYGAARW